MSRRGKDGTLVANSSCLVTAKAGIDERNVLASNLASRQDDPELNVQMANVQMALGETEQALDFFNLSLHYRFDFQEACQGKMQALQSLGRVAEAIKAGQDFLLVCPQNVDVALAAAELQYRCGDHRAALRTLEPFDCGEKIDFRVANLMGLLLGRELAEFERANVLLIRSLAAKPDWLPALTNLGWNLLEQGNYREGYEYLDRALAIAPNDMDIRLVKSCMKLKQGLFAEGWQDFGSRHYSSFASPCPFQFSPWSGQSLAEKSLLIYSEQGIGDQIMFASCFTEVITLARHTFIECNPKLVTLFQRSFPTATVFPKAQQDAQPLVKVFDSNIDFQVAMGDLPGHFRDHWDKFPAQAGYLLADRGKVEFWRAKLSAMGSSFKLGLSWRGGAMGTRKHLRSIPIEQMVPVLRLPLQGISLQYDAVHADLARLYAESSIKLMHWQEAIDDYDETAALVCALDGVLSVCTAVIHLAGALGRPTWVLAPVVPEWRYLDSGERMPWYPTVSIIRQKKMGQWGDSIELAIQRIGEEIRNK
ncbi:MAG: tetratricopeptide repeat protein [Burkholderiales bacterium]